MLPIPVVCDQIFLLICCSYLVDDIKTSWLQKQYVY